LGVIENGEPSAAHEHGPEIGVVARSTVRKFQMRNIYHAALAVTLSASFVAIALGAADSVDDAAAWSGHQLAAGGRATVNGARSLGAKLESGAKWTADEVKKYVSDLGNEIESLGGGT